MFKIFNQQTRVKGAGAMGVMRSQVQYWVCLVFILAGLPSCRKLVEVGAPVTGTNGANVYNSDATAISAVTGIYVTMSGALISISFILPSLSADELVLPVNDFSTLTGAFYTNELNANRAGFDLWNSYYQIIYKTNTALSGINVATTLTPAVKKQLMGELKFIRAFSYSYLVNLYGDVPLVLDPDYTKSAFLDRTAQADVWKQVIADLTDAQGLLSPEYPDGTLLKTTTERVRPTAWAAEALLARAYLYSGDITHAEAAATQVINNTTGYSLCHNLDSVFLKNSTEAIWQLQPVISGENTQEGYLFVLPAAGPDFYNPYTCSDHLLNAFEPNDKRKKQWIGRDTAGGIVYPYPYKYKVNVLNSPVTEYEMVLRLAEQFLIRAEAEANGAGGGVAAAVDDLNVMRSRAGLSPYADAVQKDPVLTAILHERQVELFTEWGDRWISLKRSGTVDAVMDTVTPEKGGSWSTNDQWYPLPLADIKADPNLRQNPGY